MCDAFRGRIAQGTSGRHRVHLDCTFVKFIEIASSSGNVLVSVGAIGRIEAEPPLPQSGGARLILLDGTVYNVKARATEVLEAVNKAETSATPPTLALLESVPQIY